MGTLLLCLDGTNQKLLIKFRLPSSNDIQTTSHEHFSHI